MINIMIKNFAMEKAHCIKSRRHIVTEETSWNFKRFTNECSADLKLLDKIVIRNDIRWFIFKFTIKICSFTVTKHKLLLQEKSADFLGGNQATAPGTPKSDSGPGSRFFDTVKKAWSAAKVKTSQSDNNLGPGSHLHHDKLGKKTSQPPISESTPSVISSPLIQSIVNCFIHIIEWKIHKQVLDSIQLEKIRRIWKYGKRPIFDSFFSGFDRSRTFECSASSQRGQ